MTFQQLAEKELPFVDPLGQMGFLEQHYLGAQSFVADGGSKVKFITGRPGAGKTHFLGELSRRATNEGYLTAMVDASKVQIKGVDDLYRACLQPIDVWDVVRRFCNKQVIVFLGTDPARIPTGVTYVEDCLHQGRTVEIVQREVRIQLESLLFKNQYLQRAFAMALIQMAGSVLGAVTLKAEERMTLELWVKGLPVSTRERNHLNLRQSIDRYSARLMLRSWLEFVRLSGYTGFLVTLDNFDVVLNTNQNNGLPRYTRAKRDDMYETIRELIDEMDFLESLFLVIAGRNEVFTDSKAGLRSYPALWMRVQNEVDTDRFHTRQVNRFADVIELCRLWKIASPAAFYQLAELYYGVSDLEESTRGDLRNKVLLLLEARDLTISPVQRTVQMAVNLRKEGA